MRLLAGLEHYLASTDGSGLQIHQYATGRFHGDAAGAPLSVSVNTEYPWQGRIAVTVERTGDAPWTLSLRIPQWCSAFTVAHGDGTPVAGAAARDGWLRIERSWTAGDEIVLDLDLTPRLVTADPRVDAVRGCVAIERGPLVYCLEQADHPGGGLDDIVLDPGTPLTTEDRPDLLGGVVTVVGAGHRRTLPESGWWPYRGADPASAASPQGTPVELTAVPYYAWANRTTGSMRVWLPVE
jgi:DUF1680 family protein